MIKKFCTCKHEYQDKKYGPQIRAHNATTKPTGWRCTVCGKPSSG